MSIRANYPNIRPSLNLDFANTKRLDPRITFSRASSATYVDANGTIQTAAANVPRFDHDPATGESLGLLVEEQRTNLQSYSQEFSNAGWAKTGSYLVPNFLQAPDGTYTASKLCEDGTNGTHRIAWNYGGSTGASTATIFLKSAERSKVYFYRYDGDPYYATIDLQAGTINGNSIYTATLTALTNGWYRASIYTASGWGGFVIALTNGTTNSYTGTTGSGVYIWGAQNEVGSFPTSYIPCPATFTGRSGTATYYDATGTIQTAGDGVARSNAYFPDSSGVMRPAGLLLEGASTNLVKYSEQFDNAAWNKTVGANTVTISANSATAPDGTSSADKIVTSASNAVHGVALTPLATVTSGTTYTVSIYAKAAGWSRIGIRAGASALSLRCTVNLSTGVIVDNSAGTATVASLPNGWYRISIAGVISGTSSDFIIEAHNTTSVQSSEAGDGTSGIFIWGAQLEASPYPTSYIPTTSSTVTRNADTSTSATVTRSADVASITGSNFSSWYNQNAGTIISKQRDVVVGAGTPIIWGFGSGGSNRIELRQRSSEKTRGFYINGTNISVAPLVYTKSSDSDPYTIGVAINSSGADYAAQGVLAAGSTFTNASMPSISTLYLMDSDHAGQKYISRLAYYPARLTNSQLQNLTR